MMPEDSPPHQPAVETLEQVVDYFLQEFIEIVSTGDYESVGQLLYEQELSIRKNVKRKGPEHDIRVAFSLSNYYMGISEYLGLKGKLLEKENPEVCSVVINPYLVNSLRYAEKAYTAVICTVPKDINERMALCGKIRECAEYKKGIFFQASRYSL